MVQKGSGEEVGREYTCKKEADVVEGQNWYLNSDITLLADQTPLHFYKNTVDA